MKPDMWSLIPVGYVERNEELPDGKATREQEATIVLEPDFGDCAHCLEELSHAVVLWWAHERLGQRSNVKKVHPQGRADLPLVGLFCTRSPVRPNPIALDVVKVISLNDGRLTVKGLDAHAGTPVLDIKGWYGQVPRETVTPPPWFEKLRRP